MDRPGLLNAALLNEITAKSECQSCSLVGDYIHVVQSPAVHVSHC